jgi:hypothetical protein
MQLVENQVVHYLMNEPEKHEYDGRLYRTGRMLPGTVLVFAKITEKKNKVKVLCSRDNAGKKIIPQRVDFDSIDDAKSFISNVYGV